MMAFTPLFLKIFPGASNTLPSEQVINPAVKMLDLIDTLVVNGLRVNRCTILPYSSAAARAIGCSCGDFFVERFMVFYDAPN